MKLTNKFALMSVALLTGAASFTACSNDDVLAENPGLSADGESVKTQFALNIPRAGRNARMTDVNTQNKDNTFLGMEDILLIPHNAAIDGTTQNLTHYISLLKIGAAQDNAWPETDKNIKVYNDVVVPVKTSHFLFYAHAPQGTKGTAKDCFDKGILNNTLPNPKADSNNPNTGLTNTSAYTFNLVGAKGTDTGTTTQADAVLTALNGVLGAFGNSISAGSELEKLYNAYKSLRAGSANSVLATMQKLYNNVANAAKGSTEEAIKTAIEAKFTATATPQGSTSPTEYTLTWKKAQTGDPDITYPQNINLPDGAAVLDWDTQNKKFIWAAADKTQIGNNVKLDVNSITFPASLYYFANTAVKTNVSPTVEFPKATYEDQASNVTGWEKAFDNSWADAVSPLTRKIALLNNINYSVAQLEMTFKCKAATLPANNIDKQTNQTVNVPNDGFTVTGVLVGGQPNSVGYDFLPVGQNTNTDFTKTVYDKSMPTGLTAKHYTGTFKGDATNTNYTLLLSNKLTGTSVTTQSSVNFAVELKNTSGVEFRGADGVVPVNGTFYLIGKLDPAQATKQEPASTATAVFEKDHKTLVNVTISTLATAYNCIPDLRSTNLQLGLSVDLKWQTGIQFDVELGQ